MQPSDPDSKPRDAREALTAATEHLQAGRVEDALRELNPLIAWSKAAGVSVVEASARGMRAQALMLTGQRDEALADARRAHAIAVEVGDEGGQEALAQLIAALEVASPEGGPPTVTAALQAAAGHLRAGRFDAAEATLTPLVDWAASEGEEGVEGSARGLMAQVCHAQGQQRQALEHAQRALGIAQKLGQGDVVEAFQALVAMIEQGPPAAPRTVESVFEAARGKIESGDAEGARGELLPLAQWAAAQGHGGVEAHALALLVEVALAQGQREAAADFVSRGEQLAGDDEALRGRFAALRARLGEPD